MIEKDSTDDISIWKAIDENTQIPANSSSKMSWRFYIPEHRYSIGLEMDGVIS